MAIKNVIAAGIGFSPGSVKFIPTRGFIASSAIPDPIVDTGTYARVGASESTYNRTAASDTTYNRVAASETTYPRT